MQLLHRHRRFLRATLQVFLALGLVGQPVLAAVGEVHDIEHATASHAADGHGHAQPADAGPAHDGDSEPDHAQGPHGLLHQAGGAPADLADAMTPFTPRPSSAPTVPAPAPPDRPRDVSAHPFRPPIA